HSPRLARRTWINFAQAFGDSVAQSVINDMPIGATDTQWSFAAGYQWNTEQPEQILPERVTKNLLPSLRLFDDCRNSNRALTGPVNFRQNLMSYPAFESSGFR